jgi:hypothetical protein
VRDPVVRGDGTKCWARGEQLPLPAPERQLLHRARLPRAVTVRPLFIVEELEPAKQPSRVRSLFRDHPHQIYWERNG